MTIKNESQTCDICSAEEIHIEILREDGYYIERDHALACLCKIHTDGRNDVFILGVGFNNNCDTWAKCKNVLIQIGADGVTKVFAGFDCEWFHQLHRQGDQVVKEVATDYAATGLVRMNKDTEIVPSIAPGLDGEKEFNILHDHLFRFIRFEEGILKWKGREIEYRDIKLTPEGQDFMGSEIIRETGAIDDAVSKLIIDVMWNYFHM